MTFIQFFFDLGDVLVLFTGRLSGQSGDDLKVVYFCPVAGTYQAIDLTQEQVLDSWYERAGVLPLMPLIHEVVCA